MSESECRSTESGADAAMGRRRALGRLAAVAGGAVVGTSVLRPVAADASTGAMYYGVTNGAGTDTTELYNTSPQGQVTFVVQNVGEGRALSVYTKGGLIANFEGAAGPDNGVEVETASDGSGLYVERNNSTIAGATIDAVSDDSGPVYRATSQPQCGEPLFVGTHNGYGAGMQLTLTSTTSAQHVIDANQAGVGAGVAVSITNAASSANGVVATTNGTGSALCGNGGAHARGATLVSNVAQMRLAPGTSATHPASGAAGDLFVDSAKRLWFCKGTSNWHQLA